VRNLTKLILKTFLFAAGVLFYSIVNAAFVHLNSTGGVSASDGLHIIIDDSTQLQVVRNKGGQVYQSTYTPDRTFNISMFNNNAANPLVNTSTSRLDNGVYIRGNRTIYGPNHFAASSSSPSAYTTVPMTGPTPATASAGVAQRATSQFTVPYNTLTQGPTVTIVWSYVYPYDFVTANVTLTIPALYPVSASNPVRYYHVVDTYLGGNDYGCGVRYVDTNNKQVVGTYPQTSNGCPTSTGLPANLDIVETFRERDGLKFSHYCVGFYDFWGTTSSTDCDITSTSSLNDTVSKTYRDTGMAIEYDFTLPGTYTFSYDFVVGSTSVPDYDHLEIRHAGTSSLCPFEVKVLACLSSTVPCPDSQLVSSGDLYGDLLPASSSSLTKTPDRRFQLGSANTIDTFTYQSSTATTYTLGVNNLTKAPLNGVKCWNTTTSSQSCSFVVTNTPCVNTFECMENTLTYSSSARNPLYTKVFGKDFDVDVVALLANGSQSSGYNSVTGLTVDLVLESGNTCSTATTDVVATKLVTFAASENGRKKVTFSSTATDMLLGAYPKMSYPKLRCRVRDIGLGKTGCSSDNFSIRPQSFSISTTTAGLALATPSPTSSNPLKAGTTSFNLKAMTGESGYSGTPLINAAKFYQHDGGVTVGQVAFDTNPVNLNKFPAASSGTSSSDSFKYSEVGFFQFGAQGVYDDTFTAVDKANGDCDVDGFISDSNSTPKRYGCNIGNTNASSFFGRFIPDRFEITTGGSVQACSTFVYYGQDSSAKAGIEVPFTVNARNGSGGLTTYYTGTSGYAKFNPSAWTNFNFTTSPALVGGAALDHSVFNPYLQGSWSAGQASMVARFNVARTAGPIAAQTFSVTTRVQDSDNVATTPTNIALTSATYRYGRLAITPVHGSELLPLTVPLEAQFWGGTGYRRSTEDRCTTFDIKTIAMRNYRGNLNACETVLSGSTPISIIDGKASLRLSAPGVSGNTPNTGSVDLGINFGSITAGDQTCVGPGTVQSNAIDGTAGMAGWFGANPVGRATFGVYKAPIIYMRENF